MRPTTPTGQRVAQQRCKYGQLQHQVQHGFAPIRQFEYKVKQRRTFDCDDATSAVSEAGKSGDQPKWIAFEQMGDSGPTLEFGDQLVQNSINVAGNEAGSKPRGAWDQATGELGIFDCGDSTLALFEARKSGYQFNFELLGYSRPLGYRLTWGYIESIGKDIGEGDNGYEEALCKIWQALMHAIHGNTPPWSGYNGLRQGSGGASQATARRRSQRGASMGR